MKPKKRRRLGWRKIHRVFPYMTISPEPAGILWIKGPRKIRLWENPQAERFMTIDGELKESIHLN
jgi:hypothetical protein